VTETEAQGINVGDRVHYRGRTGTVQAVDRHAGTGEEAFRARFDLTLDNGDGLHGMDYRTLSVGGKGRDG